MRTRGWVVVLGLLLGTAVVRGQDTPAEKPLTKAQQDRVKERNRLDAEAQKLRAAGKLDEEVTAIEQLLAIEREVFGDQHLDLQANVLAYLGVLHEQREDFAAARKVRQEVLALRTKLNGADHWRTTDARLALAHVERLAMLDAVQRRQLQEATQLNGQIFRLWQQGKSAEATPLAQRALAIRRELLGERHPSYAQSLFILAAQYQAQGNYAQAEPLYRQALALEKAVLGDKHPDYAVSLNNLAALYESQGEYAKAETLFRQAMELIKAVLGDKHPHYAHSLNNLAGLYSSQGEYAQAEPLFRQALALQAELLARQRQLDLAYAKEGDRGLKADADRLRKLFSDRQQSEDDVQKLVAEMVQASPQYAALRYPRACSVVEARACLGSNEVALLFALGGAESAVVLVEGQPAKGDKTDGIAIVELPKAEEINELVASLTDRDALADQPARLRILGKTAYQKLLGPVADRINGKDLVIVPGESLCYLPFELLNEDGKYLIERHRIRYAPSLTALHMIRRWEQGRSQRPKRMAWAVGDPLYPSEGVAVASRDSTREYLSREGRRDDETFPPLPASGAEVRAIAGLLGASTFLTGADVLEATVKQASAAGELAKYRYIHFATHGILGFDKGQQPALVLSLVGNDGASDELGVNDGFLRLSEVTGLKLNADLVVLSACRSGQGRMSNGEGVSGLARAFLYTGSRGVVCSLWSVADQETAELMTGMYGRLKNGTASPDALREAKLAMIRDGKPPVFWAPFILIGE